MHDQHTSWAAYTWQTTPLRKDQFGLLFEPNYWIKILMSDSHSNATLRGTHALLIHLRGTQIGAFGSMVGQEARLLERGIKMKLFLGAHKLLSWFSKEILVRLAAYLAHSLSVLQIGTCLP